VQHSTVQCKTNQNYQFSQVWCSAVRYGMTQFDTLQHDAVQYSTIQYNTVHCSTLQQASLCHAREQNDTLGAQQGYTATCQSCRR
jgi:hypothetical protein